MQRIGYRNLAFIAFLVLLAIYAALVADSDPAGRGIERAFRVFLWLAVSLAFFAINAVLLGVALAKRRPIPKPLIACLLATLSGVVALAS